MWRTPTFKEVAVGLEINCYACAEIQRMGKESNRPSKPKSITIPIEPLNMADTITFLRGIAPDTPMTEENVTRLIRAYGIKQKAYGGKIKKKMMGGMVKKTYAMGGGIRKANYK